MSLCPEAEMLAPMTDGEFWEHVLLGPLVDGPDGGYDAPVPDDDLRNQLGSPCPECGASGACAYDDEGRPLIHPVEVDE